MKKKELSNQHKILIYLIKFLALSIPIIFILEMEFYGLRVVYGIINELLLNFLGIDAEFIYLNSSVIFNEKTVMISSACTGIRSFYLLFAMLFAFKNNYIKKFKYLAIGAVLLFFLNVFRILVSSLLFFNFGLNFDNFLWTLSLNAVALIIVYFFAKNNSGKNLV